MLASKPQAWTIWAWPEAPWSDHCRCCPNRNVSLFIYFCYFYHFIYLSFFFYRYSSHKQMGADGVQAWIPRERPHHLWGDSGQLPQETRHMVGVSRYGTQDRRCSCYQVGTYPYFYLFLVWHIYFFKRKLFEVVTTLNLSSKKMKFFLKRYMTFEKEHGDQATRAHVKQKAKEYMEAKTGES